MKDIIQKSPESLGIITIDHWRHPEFIIKHIFPAMQNFRDKITSQLYAAYQDPRSVTEILSPIKYSLSEIGLCQCWLDHLHLIPQGYHLVTGTVHRSPHILKSPPSPIEDHYYVTNGTQVLDTTFAQGLWPGNGYQSGERLQRLKSLSPDLVTIHRIPNCREIIGVLHGSSREINLNLGMDYHQETIV